MQNQQAYEINKIIFDFQNFKQQVENIKRHGYQVSQLDYLITNVQQLQYKLHQMCQVNLDPEIMVQIPQMNEEMGQYQKMLEEMKSNYARNNQLQQTNIYQVNQTEEIRVLKILNEKMSGHLRRLEENQEKQDLKIQKLYELFDAVLEQNNGFQLQVQQLNNQLIQNKTQMEEKTLRINKLETQILQMQQNMNNNNQLQQQQAIQSLQNQIQSINSELEHISGYYSFQHSQNIDA
ncbi:unnamed protein product [Paramecium octaurelia]|uniref:Uncharacterized protein n=1 Tax=Paramecium octaurelia TaxID=43137 RepID=A0A8S1XDJ7_PAROT|nr:unnamed protein product [Paramecium octaurelia]